MVSNREGRYCTHEGGWREADTAGGSISTRSANLALKLTKSEKQWVKLTLDSQTSIKHLKGIRSTQVLHRSVQRRGTSTSADRMQHTCAQ